MTKKSFFSDDKRRIGLPRRPLTTLNNTTTSTPEGSDDAGSVVEFSSREDVARLLNERMKGKNKPDYKGKSEQIDYIKRLKACIKWFEEREDDYLLQNEKLRGVILSEEAKFADLEGLMRSKVEELTRNNSFLKEELEKEQAHKKVVMESLDKEREVRVAAEKSRDDLAVQLDKANQEASSSAQQVKSLQAINIGLMDYNTSLQQHNTKLRTDVATNNELVTRLHEEKNAMMELLSSLRSHSNTLQEQLSSMKGTCSSQREQIRMLRDQITAAIGNLEVAGSTTQGNDGMSRANEDFGRISRST